MVMHPDLDSWISLDRTGELQNSVHGDFTSTLMHTAGISGRTVSTGGLTDHSLSRERPPRARVPDARWLAKREGLQAQASVRPLVGCSEKLGSVCDTGKLFPEFCDNFRWSKRSRYTADPYGPMFTMNFWRIG